MKVTTAVKLTAVAYLLFSAVSRLADLFLYPLLNDTFSYAWDGGNIFSNVTSLCFVLCCLVGIVVYLRLSPENAPSVAVLLLPFIFWLLIFITQTVSDVMSFYNYVDNVYLGYYGYVNAYIRNEKISFIISLGINVVTRTTFALLLYTLVPKLISDHMTSGAETAVPASQDYLQFDFAQPAYQPPVQPQYPQQPAYQPPVQPQYPQQPAYQPPAQPQQTETDPNRTPRLF